MARLAAFRLADENGSHVPVEIADAQPGELAIASAGEQRGVGECAKLALRRVDEPANLVLREVADSRRFDLAEGLHSAPRRVAGGPSRPRMPS